MNQEEMKVKLEEAMKDEAFVKELEDAPDVEAAQKLFESKGIEFTTEELEAIVNQVQGSDDEISEGQLETVSGGTVTPLIIFAIPLIAGVLAKRRSCKW